MFGYGRRLRKFPSATPRGYTYVGSCRCGTGPHAFYQDAQGRVVPAHQLYYRDTYVQPTKEDLQSELESLRAEKAELEKDIAELEKEIHAEAK